MKERKIATNASSGAEKVEEIVTLNEPYTETFVEKTVSVDGIETERAEKENRAASERVETALRKKEETARRKAERAEKWKSEREKRNAELQKLMQEQRERREKRLAHERELQKKLVEHDEKKHREHAHRKANRSDRREKQRKRKRDDQNGGWIAAVVALGAITLGLTTALTVGAIDMKRTKDGVATGYKSTTYELVGIMENIDNDLDRARISASPAQQARILTDLLVQARLAELDLEKLPIGAESNQNLTAFLNRVGAESERMLSKLRNGETLSDKDGQSIARLYEITSGVRAELTNYLQNMTDEDMSAFIKGKKGVFSGMLDKLEKMTLEENQPVVFEDKAGAGTSSTQEKSGKKGMDSSKAEDICLRYFSDYNIEKFQCVGETVSRGVTAYNVQGYDDKGTLLFAEIEVESGALLRFDYHETCSDERFDNDNARMIAESFLEKLGYDDMEVVRARRNGTDLDFTFAYEDDGVVYYPDTVKMKVCLSRGVVTGMDASQFLKNHKDREALKVKLSMDSAQAQLHKDLRVLHSRLAVVDTARGERPAYEFLCGYAEEKYIVYIDAVTGGEIAIVNLKNIG